MEAIAKLKNSPIAPRKMRLVVDTIRGKDVNTALNILRFQSKAGSPVIEKLLLSAVSNWEQKNEDVSIEDANLFVKEVYVTEGRTLKRFRPAPQGRAHRIRKRSNHVTLVVDALNIDSLVSEPLQEEESNTDTQNES